MLSLEPTHAEAQARLHEVRQQQELATWYATGQQHYDATVAGGPGGLPAGAGARGNYKDVETLLPPPNANWRGAGRGGAGPALPRCIGRRRRRWLGKSGRRPSRSCKPC